MFFVFKALPRVPKCLLEYTSSLKNQASLYLRELTVHSQTADSLVFPKAEREAKTSATLRISFLEPAPRLDSGQTPTLFLILDLKCLF